MKQPVRKGDPTSHGGVVKTASSSFDIDGRNVALLHDIVTCPMHGDNPIIECGDGYEEHGRKLVANGCRTQCGSAVKATATGMDIA
ncbi:PAAR repeat-containing protein [Caballeronia temeraria]|uniref:PAAR repeat-containing protein n=1 Tax=Caballeronia temeraria TaxID=1777137 RepID=A0A158A6U5_9BURK|nr:PAAR domain-containing protein [Caballeronia temeraria]SAK53419.1 PAAR repeat-containing protein [Caballeronia temeraria]